MGEAVANLIRRRPLIVLFAICLIAWLPGLFTLPPLDRDESRFAQASKQMLETGNFVDIRFGVEPRYKKPAGIYWLQAASTKAIGAATGDHALNHIWTYRMPSMIGAFAAVALCFWCASAFMSVEGAFLSALLLGLTLLLAAEAKIAKTDAVQVASIIAAQGVLLRAYLARDPDHAQLGLRTAILGWVALAVGILVKGPVILGVSALTVLALVAWDREWRWLGKLRPAWGIPLALIITLPWLIAIALQSHGDFYAQSLGRDFGGKLVGGEEGHGMPPGFYLLTSIGALWPVTLFVLPAVAAVAARYREPAIRFLIAWAVPYWLVVELIPTKLPNYILPAYPAIAMMVAAFLVAPRAETVSDWRRYLPAGSALYFLIGAGLAVAALAGVPYYFGVPVTWDFIAAAGAVGILSLAAAICMLRGANGWALSLATLAAFTAYATFTLDDVPRLDQLHLSPREAEMVAKYAHPGDPAPVLVGYTEPSAMFLIGTQTRLVHKGRDGADISVGQGGGLAAVGEGQREAFLARLAELEADARPLDAIAGYAYSNGRPVRIILYRVIPPHEVTSPPQE